MQLIELWETYLYQLDTDEDGPPVMPAGVRADDVKRPAGASAEGDEQHVGDDETEPRLSGTTVRDSEEVPRDSEDTAHNEAHAAAMHTAEVEA